MSLYYETAPFLSSSPAGSLKSRVFNQQQQTRSQPKQIFALASEAAKWSSVLAPAIESSQLLELERKLTPEVALLLVHDVLLSRRGVAAPASHPLRLAVEKHKARLNAEFVKARLKRGCSSVDELRALIERNKTREGLTNGQATQNGNHAATAVHSRWARVNTLKSTLEEQLRTTFASYRRVEKLADLAEEQSLESLHIDKHIPNLIALPASIDLTKSPAYSNGSIILQDKASCFPAYLLNPKPNEGNVLDACAAPGNKTTHLAALLFRDGKNKSHPGIHACERDKTRAESLKKMVKIAGAEASVEVHAEQDFLKLDPHKVPWDNINALLLDPSCSGSGIVGRDEALHVTLPQRNNEKEPTSAKKRKRSMPSKPHITPQSTPEVTPCPDLPAKDITARLEALASFQLKLLLHAFKFPKATKVTYSTCSIYAEENEHVVVKALSSDIAKENGWRILRRHEQVEGLKAWHLRGDEEACLKTEFTGNLAFKEIAEGCIRCTKGTADGTQGFFVAGFMKDADAEGQKGDEWEGFNDDNG